MATIVEDNIESRFIRSPAPLFVILPNGNGVEVNSVLYLLHGLFGSRTNWRDLTDLEKYSDENKLVIVAPEGNDSWYVGPYESYLTHELIPFVEAKYRIRRKKDARGIAGISMGGYGAIKLGVKRPDLFSFAASMSGAFDAPRQTKERPGIDWEIMKDSLDAAFGSWESEIRRGNDVFQLIKDRKSELPEIYFDCGLSDPFLDINREFKSAIDQQGIRAAYAEFPGGHDWNYWNERLGNIVRMASVSLTN